MCVAVAEIIQQRLAGRAAGDPLCKPDLAGAALHLVGRGMLGFRHRIQRAAELDDIPVAVVPLIQQRKIIPDFVDRHRALRSIPELYIGSQEVESDIARSIMAIVPGFFAVTAPAGLATPPADRPASACCAAPLPRPQDPPSRRRRSSRYGQ